MIWLEMSTDNTHGGDEEWGFGHCLWAPVRKDNGQRWAFWSLLEEVQKGDLVIHMQGRARKAVIAGHSIASTSGYRTIARPTHVGEWDYSKEWYRVDLEAYEPLETPINIADTLDSNKADLIEFFIKNERLEKPLRLFYHKTIENEIRRTNGAYLSALDEELLEILFSEKIRAFKSEQDGTGETVQTGVSIRMLASRIGQAQFASATKRNFEYKCCFPGCEIGDKRFLVAAHIERWADNPETRGDVNNGLCFCVLHDRAYEVGLFVINDDYKVQFTTEATSTNVFGSSHLAVAGGKQIRLGEVKPSKDRLASHKARVMTEPAPPATIVVSSEFKR